MDPHHQHCYICHAYFSDRVKLGIHISSCYNSHKDRRPDLPHPEEMLMDERRYTEYVKGAMQKNREEMDLAQKRNVSYVSMGDFDDVRSQLKKPAGKPSSSSSASASPPQQGRYGGGGAPSSPTGSGAAAVRAKIPEHVSAGGKIVPTTGEDRTSALRPPSSQVVKQQTHTFQMAQQPAPPQQQQQPSSGYGITMLRNELTSELQKVKELREAEERRLTELNQPRPNSGHHNRYEPEAPFRPAKDGQQQLPPLDPNAMQPQAQPHRRVVQFQSNNQQSPTNNRPPSSHHHHTPVVGGSPSGGYPSAPPGSAHDERHTCPKCHREFGKKGYAVHVLRCGMHATEDFTYSRDRKYEHQHQQLLAEVQAPTSKITGQSEYGGEYHKQQQGGGGGPQDDAQWTQFMTTYPRPVLDEKPKTQAERARAAQNAEMKKQMMQERPPSGAEEPRVPCERCGRYFAASRIRTHEGVCISKPGRFY